MCLDKVPQFCLRFRTQMEKTLNLVVLLLVFNFVSSEDYSSFRFGNRLLFVHENRLNWFEAFETCQSEGAQLLTISSAPDNEIFRNHVSRNIMYFEGSWLGATDLANEGDWVWLNSGQAVKQTFWIPGEPNNNKDEEDCLFLTNSKGNSSFCWNDLSCYMSRPFVCEKLDEADVITGRRVFLHNNPVTFYQASEFCRSNGHRLLNLIENVPYYYDYNGLFNYISDKSHGSYWIGGSNSGEDYNWIWVDSGEEIIQPFWAIEEPNSVEENENLCLAINTTDEIDESWNKFNCNDQHNFICEEIN